MQDTITLGFTLNFSTAVADYPADASWVLHYRMVPRSGGSPVELTSTPDPADTALHRITSAAAVTAGWTAGVYSWQSWVEKATEKYEIDSGQVTLRTNPITASTLDNRSDAQIALDYVTTALSGKANGAVMSYRIGDRELRSYPMVELIALQTQLQTAVKREKRAVLLSKGMADPSKVYVRVARA
jgi:hypothetical protein